MEILLTGGTGFIGSHVAKLLADSGHQVTILARNSDKVPEMKNVNNIEIIEANIQDVKTVEELLRGKDACIMLHLLYNDPATKMLINDTLTTVQMAEIAAQMGVKHLIYTSSTAANDCAYMYDREMDDEKTEIITSHTKQRPATFYGATKAASENFLIAQAYTSGIRVNIVRPGYVYGNPVVSGAPIEGDTRMINMISNARDGKDIVVDANDGTQFIWADDIAKLYLSILESDINRRTYLALSKNFVTWEEIAHLIIKKTNSVSKVVVNKGDKESLNVKWDVSQMKEDFGLEFDVWDHLEEHVDYLLTL